MWIWIKKMFGDTEETKGDRLTKIQRNLVSHKSSNNRTLAKATSYRKKHPRKAKRLVDSYRSDFPDYYDDDDLFFMIMMYMFMYDDFGDYNDMYIEIDTMPEESYISEMSGGDGEWTPAMETTETAEDFSGGDGSASADSLVDSDIAVAETPESTYTPEPAYEPEPTRYDSGDSGGSYDSGDSGGSYDSGGSDF